MGKYMLGISPYWLKESFNNKFCEGATGEMWTGYNIKESDEIWIRRLKSDGDIIAKAKITSNFKDKIIKGNKKPAKKFNVEIISIERISTKEIFKKYGITANANHGRIE